MMNSSNRPIRPASLRPYVNPLTQLCYVGADHCQYDLLNSVTNADRQIYEMLSRWAIRDTTALIQKMKWLMGTGTRQEFESAHNILTGMMGSERRGYIETSSESDRERHRLTVVHYYMRRMPPGGIKAYDYSWIVFLSCAGHKLGFITESEMWYYISDTVDLIQGSYISWKDYIIGYSIGAVYNAADLSWNCISDHKALLARLLNSSANPLNSIDKKH
ncbi:DUF1266 domain-containing protein [Paenibacillus oenotherae]|uniref:DUF1266 domain-containing protein n=1 Tax=Paenibacillus oenotherae TaxID=1435645 RepID=A0ABS7DCH8_9BACL|nr:DUF1266 domain-containing protein [Paenibacillus oenotherae]MBW7477555.1 DUF1266 domain-containing protein [Paenibacillus oenotherae]